MVEIIDVLDKSKSLNDKEQQEVIRKHAMSDGWWDSGNDDYQHINRNVLSAVQRDEMCYMVEAIFGRGENIGLGIGGKARAKSAYEVNVNPNTRPGIFANGSFLPFKNESVSYIISTHTLEHIPNTLETLTEWVRVLKKGGVIAITIPNIRFFTHDNDNPDHKYFDLAPSEMNEKQLKAIIDQIDDIEILRYNTNNNHFDINALLMKRGVCNE